MDISLATEADIDGILRLQAANQAHNGGSLSASMPEARIRAMMSEMPLIVARRGARIIGFLMTSTRAMNADIPIICAMLGAYAGTDGAYVYGPICVDENERGKGLVQAMCRDLRRAQPGREGILFVRRDNAASLAAHKKMGMREVASFEFRGVDHAVFSFLG